MIRANITQRKYDKSYKIEFACSGGGKDVYLNRV